MYIHWYFFVLLGCRSASAVQLANARAPLVTTGALLPRQGYSCAAGQIYCTVGGGCCPSDAPCTFVRGQPRCDEPCYGTDCGNDACCPVGYTCPKDGSSFCTEISFPPAPTFLSQPSSNPDGSVATTAPPSATPEPSSDDAGSGATLEPTHSATEAETTESIPTSSSFTGAAPTEPFPKSLSFIGAASTEPFPTSSSSISVLPSSSSPISSSSSSVGAVAPTPSQEAANSSSPGRDSWMAWVFLWVMGLPFIA